MDTAKQKKKEGWLGVCMVAACCGLFLWWWFRLPSIPDPVGIPGLVERAKAESKSGSAVENVLLDLDLFELAMLRLRHGAAPEAEGIVKNATNPKVYDRFLREQALAVFNKDSGDYSPSLAIADKIADPVMRKQAREAVLEEMSLLGMAEGALEVAGENALLKARIAKSLAENGQAAKAEQLVAELLPKAETQPELRAPLTWTQLWLRRWDVVEAALPSLAGTEQEEIWQDYFRATRLERPEQAKAVLAKIPAHLQLNLRIEAAQQVKNSVEDPAALLAELSTAAESQPASAKGWLTLALASWKLQLPTAPPWRAALQRAIAAIPALPAAEQAQLSSQVAGFFLDASEITQGQEWLGKSLQAALRITDNPERFTILSGLYEQAFRSSEPEQAQQVLVEMQNAFQPATTTAPAGEVLVNALFKDGRWAEALSIADQVPAHQAAWLDQMLTRIAESTAADAMTISQDIAMHQYRLVAANQGEEAASIPAMRLPPSRERARAWLAIAKGLSKPVANRP